MRASQNYSIDLPREDPLVVELVLEYLYRCDYSCTKNSVQWSKELKISPETELTTKGYLESSDSITVVDSKHDIGRGLLSLPMLERPREKQRRPPEIDCPVLQTRLDHFNHPHFQRPGIGIAIHAGVWSFADRYDIDCLRGVALSKLELEMEFQWKSDWFLFLAGQAFPLQGPNTDWSLGPLRELILAVLLGNREFLDVQLHPDTLLSLAGLYHNLLMYLRREKKI